MRALDWRDVVLLLLAGVAWCSYRNLAIALPVWSTTIVLAVRWRRSR
jgi:hypothetical protein